MNEIDARLLLNSIDKMGNTFGDLRRERESKDEREKNRAMQRQMFDYKMGQDQQNMDLKRENQTAAQTDKDRKYRQSVIDSGTKADTASKKLDMDAEKFAAEQGYKRDSLEQRSATQEETYYDPELGTITKLKATPEKHEEFKAKFKSIHGRDLTAPPQKEGGFDASKWVKVELPSGVDSNGKTSGSITTYVPPEKFQDFIKDAASKISAVQAPTNTGQINLFPAPAMPQGASHSAPPTPMAPPTAIPAPVPPIAAAAAKTPMMTAEGMPSAPTTPLDRITGQTYKTPKGPLKWTGTGWVNPQ